MGFLSPLFLFGAIAASIPVVLHLLKREPEHRVRFSAVYLIRRVPVEHSSRRRLRELLLLALRVATLLLLAFGFARPFLASDASAISNEVVVALDTSLSMAAPGQFEKGRDLARKAVAAAGIGTRVAVVTFADEATVGSPLTADRAQARAAIEAAQPGAGGTRYRAALNASVDLLRGHPGSVVVVTDLQETGWDRGDQAAVPEAVTVSVADVGAPPPDLAVTALSANGERLLASVLNTGRQAATTRVRLMAGEATGGTGGARAVAESVVTVAGGQTARVGFTKPHARWAAVSVDDPTGVAADDTRFVAIGSASNPTVLVITSSGDLTRDAFYLEQALAAEGEDGRDYAAEAVAAGDLRSWDQARLDGYAAIVLLSTRALEHQGRALLTSYLHRGGGVIVGAGPDVDGEVLEEVLAGPRISIVNPDITASGTGQPRTWAASDVRHPIVRSIGAAQGVLGRVQFQRVAIIRTDDCAVLAQFTTGEAALVECASGEGRAIVLASDLDNRGNDFPLHATFVSFVHESVRHLLGGQRQSAEYLVGEVPVGLASGPGIAAVSRAGRPDLVAINVDPSEIESGRLTAEAFLDAAVTDGPPSPGRAPLQAVEQEDRQHIWQYLLAAMLAVMVLETWVGSRIG